MHVDMALQTRRPGQDSDTDSALAGNTDCHGPVAQRVSRRLVEERDVGERGE